MSLAYPTGGRRDCGCADDCPDPGDCPDGQECLPSEFVAPCDPGTECLPSDFIDPGDCPGCADGEECLPSDFIDPEDCPAGCDPLDPTAIEGLLAWYDADDAGTFTFTSGIEVDTWADKSGNGNDMVVQNAFGGNPSRVVNAANGRAGVYSGIEFAVDSGSLVANFAANAPMHLVFVAQWNEPPGDGASPAVGTGSDTWGIFRSGDGDLTVVANGGGHEQGFLTEDVPHVISIAFDNGTNSVYRIDGVEVFAGDLGIAGQTAMQFFQNAGGGFSLKGYMFEWMTYDHILTDDELTCIEAGLALRWMTGTCPECEGVVADYIPYAISVSGADLDALILADPDLFSYYLLDDASGNPQDSSGNANHATSVAGSITYAEPALSTASAASMRFNGAVAVIPTPTADPGAPASGNWSAAFLIDVHDFDTGVTANGFGAWLSWTPAGGSPAEFILTHDGFGKPTIAWDGDFTCNFVTSASPYTLPLDEPHVVVFVVDGFQSYLYIDGALWVTSYHAGNKVNGDTFTIGRTADTFWSAQDFHMSNLAIISRALDYSDVRAITEAMMDAAIAASGQVFS